MKYSRILLAACLTLLLAACGDEHKDKAASPPPAPSAEAPAAAPKPAAGQPRESEAAPSAAEPVASAKAPAVEAATRPEAKAPAKPGHEPETRREAKAESKVKAAKKPVIDPAIKQPLPPVQLDLRLPKDMVRRLQTDGPEPVLEDKPLLPPMFGEKTDESPFQVGGRLIQRERNERETNDDSWHSDIRGAELQLQFRN